MPLKSRTSGPKVKTGCITCKRVKCDEAKPSCNRCTSTGRKCDGYASQGSSLTLIPFKSGIQTISFDMLGTPEERRGLYYFRERAAPELAGYFTEGFWDVSLLQRAMSNPALRHAVVAFGTLHEKFASEELVAAPRESDYIFSMQQYSRAVGELRQTLEAENLTPDLVLMASLIFTSFDILRGSYDTALMHLNSGLKVLRDWVNNPNHTNAERTLLENNLRPLFVRLGMQAIVFADTNAPQNMISLWADVNGTVPHAPEDFTNLNEARIALETYMENMTEFFYICQSLAQQNKLMVEMIDKQNSHIRYFQKWGKAFDAFLVTNNSNFTVKELRAATILKIQWVVAMIMVRSRLSGVQSFEHFTPEFQTIVNLASAFVAAECKDRAITFSPEMGIVICLFFTALKCRVRTIRAEAMRLLRATRRREGMWDSATEFQLLQKLIEFENYELDMGNGNSRLQNLPDFHTSSHDYDAQLASLLNPHHEEVKDTPPQHYPIYYPGGLLRNHGGGIMPWQWYPNGYRIIPCPTMIHPRYGRSSSATVSRIPASTPRSSVTSTSRTPSQSAGISSTTMNVFSPDSEPGGLKLPNTLASHASVSRTDDEMTGDDLKTFEYFGLDALLDWI